MGLTDQSGIDWRALCQELLDALENEGHAHWPGGPDGDPLIEQARAVLAQPEPEVGEPVKQIAQIVYERAMMAAADAASRPHWPSWAELPESDARTHAMATAQAILTSCGYYTESETETAERPAVTLRTLLHPGFEPGDGNADGAQLVDGQWHVPVMGCDSLQIAVDNARAALDRPKPNRLADALARIREVSEQANTSFRPFANLLDGVFLQSEAMEPSDEEVEAWAGDQGFIRGHGDHPCGFWIDDGDAGAFARAVLARYGHQPAPPAAVAPGPTMEDVGPLIAWLTEQAHQAADASQPTDAGMLTWAAQVIGERVDEDGPAPPAATSSGEKK